MILLKAFTFFTTHFRELDQLSIYPNVAHFHLNASTVTLLPGNARETEQATQRFKLAPGFVPEESYGINLAVIAGLPADLLGEARRVRDLVKESKLQAREHSDGIEAEAEAEKTQLQLFARLVEASMSSNPSVLKYYLQSLQHQLRQDSNFR